VSSGAIAAVDLGASSGRVVVGHVGPGVLSFEEVHRFANEPVIASDGLYTDIRRLFQEVLVGLRGANVTAGPLRTIGIDTWGVDYGLVDEAGELLGDPVHYRDSRHRRGMELVDGIISPERLYATNGLQVLPFNTLYQLAAARENRAFASTDVMLLLPDLLAFWLTGIRAAETTNASTTGLLDARSRTWADSLIEDLGLPASLLAPLSEPGQSLGPLLSTVANDVAMPAGTVVTAVGSHDTASAVVAVPAETSDFAYVSCGTWGLVGLELEQPILSEASRMANFTNEAGVDGRVRYLRNVMGLWLLQETLRTWERAGEPQDLDRLLRGAAAGPSGGPLINPDDPVFLPPGDMVQRIDAACDQTAQPRPASKAAMVRCILDSLASAFARAVGEATQLAGHDVKVVHILGGGARNELLCQLTADASGRPVVAGPFEATALGNILIQARSVGLAEGTLESLRALVRASQSLKRYEPSLGSVVHSG
jgi:rhamnulokinase